MGTIMFTARGWTVSGRRGARTDSSIMGVASGQRSVPSRVRASARFIGPGLHPVQATTKARVSNVASTSTITPR